MWTSTTKPSSAYLIPQYAPGAVDFPAHQAATIKLTHYRIMWPRQRPVRFAATAFSTRRLTAAQETCSITARKQAGAYGGKSQDLSTSSAQERDDRIRSQCFQLHRPKYLRGRRRPRPSKFVRHSPRISAGH